ncbi:MAG: hypothetical protein QM296_07690 [Bacillota bacterium]|nr:hypothetical protein [Bacillota bacterium]
MNVRRFAYAECVIHFAYFCEDSDTRPPLLSGSIRIARIDLVFSLAGRTRSDVGDVHQSFVVIATIGGSFCNDAVIVADRLQR